MNNDPEQIPVIVGVGQVIDRPVDAAQGLDALGLMAAALRAADTDAGGGWLKAADWLGVVDQLSFRDQNPLVGKLAAELAMTPARQDQTPHPSGDSPILLLNEAANRIGSGEIRVAAIVGGEALRTAAQRAAAASGTDVASHNVSRARSAARAPSYRQRYGLVAPVDIYPLYENAGRAAYGQSLTEAQAETGQIWSLFSEVADGNPAAWIHRPMTPQQITTPTADNRPIAHPYTKLMVANSSVNQGAGFIVASLAEARRRGVAEERLVYVGNGAAAHEPDEPVARSSYNSSTSMAVSIGRALELNGVLAAELDMVELYSCFPCVPKMARRLIDWPVERPATVFGGLTFGGGPIANYMSHAVGCMAERLRQGGRYGLLFANGGFATHNHTIVLSSEPIVAAVFPRDHDYQAEADRLSPPVAPFKEEYEGSATIETYTVLYRRDGAPSHGVIMALTPDGSRTLARVRGDDDAEIDFLTSGAAEPVGASGTIVRDPEGDQIWHSTARTSS